MLFIDILTCAEGCPPLPVVGSVRLRRESWTKVLTRSSLNSLEGAMSYSRQYTAIASHAFRMSLARLCGLKKASFSIVCSRSGSNTGRVNSRFEWGRLRCSVLEDVDASSSEMFGPLLEP